MVDLEGKEAGVGGGGQEMDTPLTLPLAMQGEKERGRRIGFFFNQ